MLAVDQRIVDIAIVAGIALTLSMAIPLAITVVLPDPYMETQTYSSQPGCEAAGMDWLEDEYGGYCDTYSRYNTTEECDAAGGQWMQDEWGEYCEVYGSYPSYQEYNAYYIVYSTILLAIGIALIAAGLFFPKNKLLAYALLAAGIIEVLTAASSMGYVLPVLLPICIGTLLIALVLLAIKRGGKPF